MSKCEHYDCMRRDNIYVCADGKIYCNEHMDVQKAHIRDLCAYWASNHDMERSGYFQELASILWHAKHYESIDAYEAEMREKDRQSAEAERQRIIALANGLLARAKQQRLIEKENAVQARKLISEAESLTGNGKYREAINLLEGKYTWTTENGNRFFALLSDFDSCLEAALKEEAKAEAERLQKIAIANELLTKAKQQRRFENENEAQARKLISEAESLAGSGKHQEAIDLLEKNHSWIIKGGGNFYAALPYFDSILEATLKEIAEARAKKIKATARKIVGIVIGAFIGGIIGFFIEGAYGYLGRHDTGFITGIIIGGIIAFIAGEEAGAGAKKGALFGVIGFLVEAIIIMCIYREGAPPFLVAIFIGPIGGAVIGALNGAFF